MSDLLKLLYVEDDADIRAIAEIALEGEGFELFLCESGEQALVTASKMIPDLIILDVMMPNMDGPTTLLRLRELSSLKNTPAIFMTAKVQPQEIDEYRAMGAIDVIAKPFDAMALADQIRAIMGGLNDR